MQWIHDYQLFLFDFDGLLVNSEEIHFEAYQRMCATFGFQLAWNFDRYCLAAHYDAVKLRDEIYASLPQLKQLKPSWDELYTVKKNAVIDLVREGAVHMMPGAERLLTELNKAGIKSCVVTHSPDVIVSLIRSQNPILNTIPYWITREDYTHPKPDPECYITAISRYAEPQDQVIGFEDTPRGMKALMGSRAKPVLICHARYPEIVDFTSKGVLHFPSLESIENFN